MKRFVSVLFLLILLCVGVVFEDRVIDVFSEIPFQKITTTSSDAIVAKGVLNGNDVILTYDNLKDVNLDTVKGVTMRVSKDFDINRFMKIIGLHNPLRYCIDNFEVVEGKLIFKNNLNFDSVQIAIKQDVIIIGFPTIMEGF